jgi:hypothetical protein
MAFPYKDAWIMLLTFDHFEVAAYHMLMTGCYA